MRMPFGHLASRHAFHSHFLDSTGVRPNEDLWPTYDDLLSDDDVKKIILRRDNVFAVYVSSRRSQLTGAYMSVDYSTSTVQISPPALQAFIWQYERAYAHYRGHTARQRTFVITYEELDSSKDCVLGCLFFCGDLPLKRLVVFFDD